MSALLWLQQSVVAAGLFRHVRLPTRTVVSCRNNHAAVFSGTRKETPRRLHPRSCRTTNNNNNNDINPSCNYTRAFSSVRRNASNNSTNNITNNMIRLSKRMSELDICSRREADRLIVQPGRVLVNGKPVEPILGQKVPCDETDIVLVSSLSDKYNPRSSSHNDQNEPETDDDDDNAGPVMRRPLEFSWSHLQTAAVVLHKPLGYVSGMYEDATTNNLNNRTNNQPSSTSQQQQHQQQQPQQQHVPAVRLLTPSNAYIVPTNYYPPHDYVADAANVIESYGHNNNYQYDYRNGKEEYHEALDIVQHRLDYRLHRASNHTTLHGYVPAGRLDLNSSGLLLFVASRHGGSGGGGVLAKKLVSPHGLIEKEYLVLVEPLQQQPRHHHHHHHHHPGRRIQPTKNLARIRKGGHGLWENSNDQSSSSSRQPLRPAVAAEWLRWKDYDTNKLLHQNFSLEDDLLPNERRRVLRIVLKEGRKHQVRRMCREILGMHVVKLIRTRIGSIELDSIPNPGTWRPLRQEEARAIYFA